VKSGAKGTIEVEPLSFRGWPRARAARRLRFVRTFCVVPRGLGAGKPVRLREFQTEIVNGAFAPGVRTAVVSIPRANGKTALAAMLGLAELFVGPPSAECLIVASDQRQADITLKLARRMVELNPVLAERVQVYRDRLYLPENDATLIPLPAEPGALHGHDGSLIICDELHVVGRDVWEAVTSAAGKRAESLTLAISTPSSSPDCVMFDLVEHGRSGTDPAFYLREYAAPEGCAIDDRDAWRIANPALADARPFMAEDGLAAVMRTVREPVFRQLRLGQWAAGVDAWIGWTEWAACTDAARVVADGEPVVLAFDGSASGDSTALVGCTLGADPHLFLLALWENPGDPRWRVPRADVSDVVDAAFARFDVAECSVDPWGWRAEQQQWADRHGETRVVEWNTADARRMAPATDRLYQAVAERTITHDGDARLAAHVAHCVAKSTALGDLVSKDKRHSPRKIDAAVAAIVAADRAAWHTAHRRPSRKRVVSW
jgi:phage terminase large subunit-like protein